MRAARWMAVPWRRVAENWILWASLVAWLATTLVRGALPHYTLDEGEVLLALAALFVSVRLLTESAGFVHTSARILGQGRPMLRLTLATFVVSALLTNDAVLLVALPLALKMGGSGRGLRVAILAAAANAGSALMPMGNPQNLFLFWHYGISVQDFLRTMLPFWAFWLVVLGAAAWGFGGRGRLETEVPVRGAPAAWPGLVSLGFVLLVTLRALPVWVLLGPVTYGLAVRRQALRIDYALLATFGLLIGVSDNVVALVGSGLPGRGHVFWLTVGLSQVASNVPATVLLSDLTDHWRTLAWASNAAGFGFPVGSLANLIALRLLWQEDGTSGRLRDTLVCLALGPLTVAATWGLFLLVRWGL